MVPNKKNGVIFIVQGDVVVEPGVTQIDAVIFTNGTFYSSATYDGSIHIVNSTNQLLVNGSVIAKGGLDLARTTPSTAAAETFKFDPKYYWLFKEVMSGSKAVWSEVPG